MGNPDELPNKSILRLEEKYNHLDESLESLMSFLDELLHELQLLRDSSRLNENIQVMNNYISRFKDSLRILRVDAIPKNNQDLISQTSIDIRSNIPQMFTDLKNRLEREETSQNLSIGDKTIAVREIVSPISMEEFNRKKQANDKFNKGPDGFYAILNAPAGWVTEVMSNPELINFLTAKLKDQSLIEDKFGISNEKNILVVHPKEEIQVIPIPGKTLVNGRLLNFGLTDFISPQLIISPLERIGPPLYMEKTLLQSFYEFLGQVLVASILVRVSTGVIKRQTPDKDLPYLTAEAFSTLENVEINGQVESYNLIIKIFAFRGEIKDYVCLIRYPSFGNGNQLIKNQIDTLNSIAYSFRPIELYDPELERRYRSTADDKFLKLIEETGTSIFKDNLFIALARFKNVDLEDNLNLHNLIKGLQAFPELSTRVKYLEDEEVTELWDEQSWERFWNCLQKAEQGSNTEFKGLVKELMDKLGITE